MMIAKRKMGRGKVRVTFSMPKLDNVHQLYLVGDFNHWSIADTPMQQAPDSTWSAVLSLDSGQDYQFRYLANGTDWLNDTAADGYLPNEFGTDNSVVSLKESALLAAKKSTRKKSE
jgi:1,4-alpha-glucan branching enzyme